jgi:toxin ParE1/3/4
MKGVDFHPEEARAAAQWHADIRPDLGDGFRDDLRNLLERILRHPFLYAASYGALREAPFSRFSYSVIYEVEANRIWIAAVSHHRRRPGYWLHRLKNPPR